MIIFGKGLSGGKLIVKYLKKQLINQKRISSSETLPFTVLPAVMLLSTVLQENVLQFVTLVHMQLSKVLVNMAVNI